MKITCYILREQHIETYSIFITDSMHKIVHTLSDAFIAGFHQSTIVRQQLYQ